MHFPLPCRYRIHRGTGHVSHTICRPVARGGPSPFRPQNPENGQLETTSFTPDSPQKSLDCNFAPPPLGKSPLFPTSPPSWQNPSTGLKLFKLQFLYLHQGGAVGSWLQHCQELLLACLLTPPPSKKKTKTKTKTHCRGGNRCRGLFYYPGLYPGLIRAKNGSIFSAELTVNYS